MSFCIAHIGSACDGFQLLVWPPTPRNLTRDELLLKLGAARKEAGKAYALLVIHMPTKDQPHIRNIPLRTGPKEIAAGLVARRRLFASL